MVRISLAVLAALVLVVSTAFCADTEIGKTYQVRQSKVIQVIDGSNMIVELPAQGGRLTREVVWLKGIKTDNATDGAFLDFGEILFTVRETKTYRTVLGGSRTVFLYEAESAKEREERKARAAALAKREDEIGQQLSKTFSDIEKAHRQRKEAEETQRQVVARRNLLTFAKKLLAEASNTKDEKEAKRLREAADERLNKLIKEHKDSSEAKEAMGLLNQRK